MTRGSRLLLPAILALVAMQASAARAARQASQPEPPSVALPPIEIVERRQAEQPTSAAAEAGSVQQQVPRTI